MSGVSRSAKASASNGMRLKPCAASDLNSSSVMFLSGPPCRMAVVCAKNSCSCSNSGKQGYQAICVCQRRHSQASKAPGGISLIFLTRNMAVSKGRSINGRSGSPHRLRTRLYHPCLWSGQAGRGYNHREPLERGILRPGRPRSRLRNPQ